VSRRTACRATDIVHELKALHSDAKPTDEDRSAARVVPTSPDSERARQLRELQESVNVLAQHVQALTLENLELRAALKAPGSVVSITRGNHGPV
jgi:hypothetical protein